MKYGNVTTPYDPRIINKPLPPAINHDRNPQWAFDILEIYPATVMFLSGPLYAVINLCPTAVNRCRMIMDVYMADPTNAAERVALEYGLVSVREVVREDLNTAEGCTDATGSGVLKHIQLGDQEIAVRHSYAVVEDAVRAYLAEKVA